MPSGWQGGRAEPSAYKASILWQVPPLAQAQSATPETAASPLPVPSAGSYESTLEVSPFSYFHAELYCRAENSIFPLQQMAPVPLAFSSPSLVSSLFVQERVCSGRPEEGPRFTATNVPYMLESCAAASHPCEGDFVCVPFTPSSFANIRDNSVFGFLCDGE